MNLYKRPNSPFWWYDQTINGHRRRVSTKRTNKREAEAVATSQISAALDQHQLGRVPEITLRAALFEKYLPTRVGLSSYVNLERSCRALVGDREKIKALGWGGDMPFHEIDEDMMRTYRIARNPTARPASRPRCATQRASMPVRCRRRCTTPRSSRSPKRPDTLRHTGANPWHTIDTERNSVTSDLV